MQLICHYDKNSPLVSINILYNVGSKDENPNRTGFAHLFEHLMFGGSLNIPEYDKVSHLIGASNNAFTSTDITNYYITLPKENFETALWLESDRMNQLDFSERSLQVQRDVVIEEFRQRYLNQPYGDLWLKLRPLSYKTHPYSWATIGKSIDHIKDAKLSDVEAFFNMHYKPKNAIISVAGGIDTVSCLELVNKWFGKIEKVKAIENKPLPKEPRQNELRRETIVADVPLNAIYMAFHIPGRKDEKYYKADFLSDVLGRGKSARLEKILVHEKGLFNQIFSYVSGEIDPGLLIIGGMLNDGVEHIKAENEIWSILAKLSAEIIDPSEKEKIINQIEAEHLFGLNSAMNIAFNLAFYTHLGDTDLVNTEIKKYTDISAKQLIESANEILRKENCSIIYYKKN